MEPSLQSYKGRVVYQGNQVKDSDGLRAVFSEVGSSSCIHSQWKMLDAVARLPGCAGEMSDAVKAYTQAKVEDYPELQDNFVELLRDQWPKHWIGKYSQPVCPLLRNLYGHPVAGKVWEQQCRKTLRTLGFDTIPGWENIYKNREKKLFMSI